MMLDLTFMCASPIIIAFHSDEGHSSLQFANMKISSFQAYAA